MSDFIEEIKEDVKIERWINFLKLYGNYILITIFVVVIGISGYVFWQHRTERQHAQEAVTFEQAQQVAETGKTADALKLLAALDESIAQGSAQGYKIMALFQQTSLEGISAQEKSKIYQEISDNPKIETKFRELATILWGYENMDQGDLTALRRKISPLAEGKGVWQDSALELMALIAIRSGETKNALQQLKYLLSNENTTPGVRQRALALFEQMRG